MTKTVFIAYFAWALLQCAPVNAVLADTDSPPPATANTQLQANGTEESRLSRLAQRLAEGQADDLTDAQADEVGTDDSVSSTDGSQSGTTSLLTGTPLLRPGATDKIGGDEAERPGTTYWFIKTLTALGIVVGLALFIRWVYIRLGGKVAASSNPVVEVLSRTAVAPRSHVMLLRVGGRVLVVSESSAGMRTLASLEDDQEVADILGAVDAAKPNSISRGFGQLLNRFNEDYDQQPDGLGTADADAHRTGGPRETVSGLLSKVRAMGRQGGAS